MKFPNIHGIALNFPGVAAAKDIVPLYFTKAASCWCPSGSRIRIPRDIELTWTEVELGVVVSGGCQQLKKGMGWEHIEGYVVAADITSDNILGRDHHLAASKSRAGFCPTSSSVVFIERDKVKGLSLITEINGKITQSGNTSQMLFDPARCVEFISQYNRLCAGDLILTGTPAGHEKNVLKPGDRVRHLVGDVSELNFEAI